MSHHAPACAAHRPAESVPATVPHASVVYCDQLTRFARTLAEPIQPGQYRVPSVSLRQSNVATVTLFRMAPAAACG
eukprot:362918-Amphidinium_carterae.1